MILNTDLLGIHPLTIGLHDLRKWVFWASKHRGGRRGGQSKIFLEIFYTFLLKIVSSQPNIRNTFFDHRSLRPPEVDFFGLCK